MKYIKIILVAIVVIISSRNACIAASSSDKLPPSWINNPPRSLNNSYSFKVVESDAGSDLSSAREHSRKELTRSIAREFNLKVSDQLSSQSTTNYNGAKTTYSGKDVYELSIKSNDGNIRIYYERIDEYYIVENVGGNKVFRLYTLYAVPNQGVTTPTFDNFEVTSKYGCNGLWRSAIVPGWGQFYKGSKLKGGLMLSGVAALGVSAIFVNNQANDYTKKMKREVNLKLKRSYSTKADNYTSGRNVLIGGAAALYIYNIVDAIVAPGASRVKVSRYSVAPTVMNNGSVGVSAQIKF